MKKTLGLADAVYPRPQPAGYARFKKAQKLMIPAAHNEGAPALSRKGIREMQAAYVELLSSEDPIPEEMREYLAVTFRFLCSGCPPALFKNVHGTGGSVSPLAHQFHRVAVAYLRACESGLIADESPVTSVARAFEVTEGTVRRWKKRFEGEEQEPPRSPKSSNPLNFSLATIGAQYRKRVKVRD